MTSWIIVINLGAYYMDDNANGQFESCSIKRTVLRVIIKAAENLLVSSTIDEGLLHSW